MVPIIIGKAIDCLVYKKVDFINLRMLLIDAVIVIIIAAVSLYLVNLCNNKLSFCVVRDIRNDAFVKLQGLSFSYLDTVPAGDVLSRIIVDTEQLSDGLLVGFTQVFSGLVTILGTLLFMLKLNVALSLVVIIVTPMSLFVARYISKNTYVFFGQQSKIRGKQTSLINEMIGNAKVVKAFAYEEHAVKRFRETNDELGKISLKAVFYSSLTNPSTRFVNSVVYALVALFGALTVLRGNMSVGILASFLSYANQYTKPFNEISGVITEVSNALAGAKRVFEFIDKEVEFDEKSKELNISLGEGRVECNKVDFSYVKDKELIKDLNLSVKPGNLVAIVGPTGCGKTTVINLLMRFYDVDNGCICVEGNDIRKITRNSLRGSYGMVLQDTWLRNRSVRDNIKMGYSVSDEKMLEATKAAHAHSFIKKMENGYDTIITEDGANLSQGQKQLLCIARIMLRLPPMLILDEATSSIDTRTEMKIQDAFTKMMEGRTTFVVAHRLSTIKNADTILVMKDGRIIEQGKHEELFEKKGFYYELCQAASTN